MRKTDQELMWEVFMEASNSGIISTLAEKQIGVSNKPARFYVFNRDFAQNNPTAIYNLRMDGSFTLFN